MCDVRCRNFRATTFSNVRVAFTFQSDIEQCQGLDILTLANLMFCMVGTSFC